MADWVHLVERAYVAAATGGAPPPAAPTSPRALAAAGAVASHYLAVGTPRNIGLVGGDDAVHSLVAHRTWFNLGDVRCTSASVAALVGGRRVALAEALTADIVCLYEPMVLAASQLRRGTHVNALGPIELDDELRALATIVDEPAGLAALAAGLVDGRQLDEITIFIAGGASIASAVLAAQAP
jgi:ornithine cyclodeaminase/alanine dehydrogenase-like protein (mu-crystallin family)